MNTPPTSRLSVGKQAARCFWTTLRLLGSRKLHIANTHVGDHIPLPDSRIFEVFRGTTRDAETIHRPVTLTVWFHLRSIPAHAAIRRYLFERLCIVNTLLFAGCDGYLVKLWMVDPETSDYAGLYSWRTGEEADAYGRYITAILQPLSAPRSVGYIVLQNVTLQEYLVGDHPADR